MAHRRHLTVLALLLGTVWAAPVASAEEQLRNQIEIDRSVLQDLKGYEPPPMFAPAAPAPLKRAAVALQAPTLTTPKAEDVLEFPVQNSEVVTRQRMTAPEEAIASVRPDFSDSRTILKLKPKVAATKDKPAEKASAKIAKAPLPPKKPSLHLAAASSADKEIVKAAQVAPAESASVFPLQETAPMKPAKPAPKYVPKSRPSMPAVSSGTVEKASLDAFNLPTEPDAELETKNPSPGERVIDQALTRNMIDAGPNDVESVMSGGKASTTKTMQLAALPPAAGAPVPVISMEYVPRLIELQTDQRNTLKIEILPFLQKKDDARLQIMAYADGGQDDSEARRISLSRALAVRAFLLEGGIDPSRIDIRALGNNTTENPVDRVDLKFIR